MRSALLLLCGVLVLSQAVATNLAAKQRALARAPEAGVNDVTINKRLLVNGAVKATSMTTKNLTVVGDASAKVLTSSRVTTSLLATEVLETGVLRSPTGVIIIDGNLQLSGEVAEKAGGESFLSLGERVRGGRQWRLAGHDDFEDGTAGWQFTNRTSVDMRSTCGAKSDHFLGGHCRFANQETSKVFTDLPRHTQIRVKARAHFLDSWNGEVLFAKVGDAVVWADTCNAPVLPGAALNICGASSPDLKLSSPIDVVLPHSSSTVEVTFGSTLNGDPCEQSWGIDDVMVYTN